ncbi:hypothetical protein [Spirosoma pulveris]
MDPFQALLKLPQLIEDYERVSQELAQTKKELADMEDDRYVTWEWICEYFQITRQGFVNIFRESR